MPASYLGQLWLRPAGVFLNTVAKPILEVKPKDILGFIQRQRETPPFVGPEGNQQGRGLASLNPGLSANTIRRRLATISGLYEFLRIRGDPSASSGQVLERASPVPRGLPTRRQFWFGEPRGRPGGANRALVRSPRTLPQPLDTEDVNQFLSSLRTLRDKAIVLLMLLAGLRKGEVLGLALQDINFAKQTVMVRDGKGGHDRLVPMSSVALEATLRYLNEERPASSTDRVFLVLKGPHRGLPLTTDGLQMVVRHHRRKAGTPQVQCHRLRHTCLTHLRQAGMSLERIADLLGHQSLSMTRVYARLSNQTLLKEYNTVSTRLEQLSGQAPDHATAGAFRPAPTTDRPPQPHWRLLGNGYCTRPEGMPCEYESICEACPCFQSTPTLLPHLCRQLEDAQARGHSRRADLLARVIQRLEATQSTRPDRPP